MPVTVGKGKVSYGIGDAPCSGTGLEWSPEEVEAAMDGRVAAVLFDDEGKANIEEILTGVAETDFDQGALLRVLEDANEIEDWRVGEAIAETYLTDHRSCSFPWPDGRDERTRRASLPGADLVGFGVDEHGDCLAFGEVKTSSDPNHPPGVMYGRTGLKQQLEDLRDRTVIRDGLLKYLGHRAEAAPWRARYERAGRRYLQDSSDVQLYGFLVRDVEPHREDLRARVSGLGDGRPQEMCIELLALYLPRESLDGIGKDMVSRRKGVDG